jgi:hypothetical protein
MCRYLNEIQQSDSAIVQVNVICAVSLPLIATGNKHSTARTNALAFLTLFSQY